MLLIEAPGLSAAELRVAFGGLGPDVVVLAPPSIDDASLTELGVLAVDAVNGLPALLAAIAALWSANTASRQRRDSAGDRALKAVKIQTSMGTISVPVQALREGTVSVQIPELDSVRLISLEVS